MKTICVNLGAAYPTACTLLSFLNLPFDFFASFAQLLRPLRPVLKKV